MADSQKSSGGEVAPAGGGEVAPVEHAAGRRSAEQQASAGEPERYTVEGWQERARSFKVDDRGVSRHALAGALHDVPGHELLTRVEVERRVKAFMTTPEHELP